jgi:hypothetical protein
MSFGSIHETLRRTGNRENLTSTGLQDFIYKGTISLSSSGI